ncbi:hypothetical protein D3C86_1068350 [compost metagenome]
MTSRKSPQPEVGSQSRVYKRTETGSLILHVDPSSDAAPAEDLQPLFYRGITYMMPASIVKAPLPTFTFRHLEKVGVFALEGNHAKVLSSLQRAVSSAVDAPSLIKIAAAAHSEDVPEEAMTALQKALKAAKKDPAMERLVRASAQMLGYSLDLAPRTGRS